MKELNVVQIYMKVFGCCLLAVFIIAFITGIACNNPLFGFILLPILIADIFGYKTSIFNLDSGFWFGTIVLLIFVFTINFFIVLYIKNHSNSSKS